MKILLQEQLFVQELVTVKHYTDVTFHEPAVKTNTPLKVWHPLIWFVRTHCDLVSLFPVKMLLKEQHYSTLKLNCFSSLFSTARD